MQQEYILSAVGDNKPGVVANVTEAIYLSGCNVENSSMLLLGNHFTLMIHFFTLDENSYQELQQRCEKLQQEKEIKIFLFPMEGAPTTEPETFRGPAPHYYEIRVRGVDKSGIIYRTSNLLASRNINIIELGTSVDRSPKLEAPLFTMRIVAEVPKELDSEALRKDLEYLAEDLQETISLTRCEY